MEVTKYDIRFNSDAMKSSNALMLIPILLLIATSSCSQKETEWRGTIEEKDGLIIVKNPREPMYSGEVFNIKEDLSFGASEGPEEYMFNRIRGVDVDREGNIFVLDSQSVQIRVFDKSGQFLREFGRQGQGPGEMEMPIFIQITAEEEIVIFDPLTRRFVFFSPLGDYLRQVSTSTVGNPMHPIRLVSKGKLYAQVQPPPPMGGTELKEFDFDLGLAKTIYKVEMDDLYLRAEFKVRQPEVNCAVSSDGVVVWGFADKYELDVMNTEGKLSKKILKDSKPVRLTDNDREDLRERYSRSSVSRLFKLVYPDFFPAFHDISIDESGRIFVGTYNKVEENELFYYYDLFDPDGRYIARAPIKARSTVGFIWKMNKLFTIETDNQGFYIVKRYKVTWNY